MCRSLRRREVVGTIAVDRCSISRESSRGSRELASCRRRWRSSRSRETSYSRALTSSRCRRRSRRATLSTYLAGRSSSGIRFSRCRIRIGSTSTKPCPSPKSSKTPSSNRQSTAYRTDSTSKFPFSKTPTAAVPWASTDSASTSIRRARTPQSVTKQIQG